MEQLTGLTIRLSPAIEAEVSKMIARAHDVADMAWWACAAVAAAAVVYILRSVNGGRA